MYRGRKWAIILYYTLALRDDRLVARATINLNETVKLNQFEKIEERNEKTFEKIENNGLPSKLVVAHHF